MLKSYEADGVWTAMMEGLHSTQDALIEAQSLGLEDIADEIDDAWHDLWKHYNHVLDMIDKIGVEGWTSTHPQPPADGR